MIRTTPTSCQTAPLFMVHFFAAALSCYKNIKLRREGVDYRSEIETI
jgi:hypothetical protein